MSSYLKSWCCAKWTKTGWYLKPILITVSVCLLVKDSQSWTHICSAVMHKSCWKSISSSSLLRYSSQMSSLNNLATQSALYYDTSNLPPFRHKINLIKEQLLLLPLVQGPKQANQGEDCNLNQAAVWAACLNWKTQWFLNMSTVLLKYNFESWLIFDLFDMDDIEVIPVYS